MLALSLPFFAIIPVLIAVFLYVFAGLKKARIIAVIAQTAFVALAFSLVLASREGEIITRVGGYDGYLGIILRADTLAAVFVLLTVVIFLAVVIYNLRSEYDHTGRLYWFLLFILEGVLIGLFLTRDFFNVFVLVEVSTVVVVILLMYDRKRRNLFAGMTFIMINIVVMQFFLFGVGYLYMITGVMDMEAATYAIASMDSTSDLVLPYALIMTSVAAKCSLLPLLTWLPKVNSLTGSRYTIAAIMSGLHVKSGIYLFIRVQDVFGGMASEFFLIVGIVTAVAGVVLALSQKDIRLMLAYSTVAQAGLIVAGLSLGGAYFSPVGTYSDTGSLLHIVNHALIKVALFLAAGMISFRFNTTDITKIRGLYYVSPAIAIANVLAILGIVGAPFFNGFVSKYFIAYGAAGVLEWVFIAVNLGTVLVFVRYSAIFLGRPLAAIREVRTDWCRLSVVLGLGVSCVLLGVFGTGAARFLFGHSVYIMGDGRPFAISIWGYLEKSLVFFVSLGVGLLAYRYVPVNKGLAMRLRGVQLSFKILCMSIGVFFGVLLVVVGVL
ncbi:MAG: hypothetical protein FWC77_07190 [Defluviitaleaceae bacterium]|nr:hypothetical protein [Defluviitaleaceae bacterium]